MYIHVCVCMCDAHACVCVRSQSKLRREPGPKQASAKAVSNEQSLTANTPLAPTVYRSWPWKDYAGVRDMMTASNAGSSKDPRKVPDAKGITGIQEES